jgi:hypothetical protein
VPFLSGQDDRDGWSAEPREPALPIQRRPASIRPVDTVGSMDLRHQLVQHSVPWSLAMLGAALVLDACGAGGSSSGARAISPTRSDAALITAAFNHWEQLPSSCNGEIVSGSLRVATVADGDSWAAASFTHGSDCTVSLAPTYPGGAPRPISPSQIGPFAEQAQPVIAIFNRSAGEAWAMTGEAGTDAGGRVFPCSVGPGGTPPGPGTIALPAPVIAAWHLKPRPVPDCSSVSVLPTPR